MPYTPENNPYIPGDPYSYDLKWIVSKLNEFSTSIQTLSDDVQDLQTQFGPIQGLIADIISGRFPFGYLTVSKDTTESMIADVLLEEGALVNTSGYHTIGDSGDGLFYLTSSVPVTPYVTLDNGLYGMLIDSVDKINVKQLGAIGDGTTNNDSVFATAVYFMQTLRRPIYLPKGDYLIDNPIMLTSDGVRFLMIEGESSNGTVIRANGAAAFDLDFSLDQITLKFMQIKNITITGNGNYPTGIKMYYNTEGLIENVYFRDLAPAIDAFQAWIETIRNCRFTEIETGYNAIVIKNQCNAFRIEKCTFGREANETSASIAITSGGASISVSDCVFDHGNGVGIAPEAGRTLTNVVIENCYFEYITNRAISASGSSVIHNLIIDGIYVAQLPTATQAPIHIGDVAGASIANIFADTASSVSTVIQDDGNSLTRYFRHVANITSENNIQISNRNIHYEQYASSAPSTGNYGRGEICWNANASSGSPIGWVCTAAGSPGMWRAMPNL